MKPLRAILMLVLIGLMCSPLYAQKCEDDPFTETDESLACSDAFKNTIGMEFVLIPAGSFTMGSDNSDDEKPTHRVRISQSFYLGKYEVTQEQWYKVMKKNPAHFKTEKVGMNSRNHPIESVSWNDVQEFIRRLNKKEGGNKYRLPTEAEWEYAARAGTTSTWPFGNSESYAGNYAWFDGNSGKTTHPVGQKYPNKWGLHDMSGNVWEWVQDWYNDKYYSRSPSTDPKGPSSGSRRVLRGGSWGNSAGSLRPADRLSLSPGNRYDSLGFRLLRIR